MAAVRSMRWWRMRPITFHSAMPSSYRAAGGERQPRHGAFHQGDLPRRRTRTSARAAAKLQQKAPLLDHGVRSSMNRTASPARRRGWSAWKRSISRPAICCAKKARIRRRRTASCVASSHEGGRPRVGERAAGARPCRSRARGAADTPDATGIAPSTSRPMRRRRIACACCWRRARTPWFAMQRGA